MPRQPFLPTYSHIKSYSVGLDTLESRPELGAIIASCICVWANVELQIGLCLGAILGVQSDGAVAVFLSLRNARAQREAISAAAGTCLSDEDSDVVEAVLAIYASIGKHRHDLAHGIYGYSDELPDSVLWTESSKHAHFLIDVYNREAKKAPVGADPHAMMKRNLFVYRKCDLKETHKAIIDAWDAAFNLHCYLKGNEQSPSERFRRLCSLPLVERELRRIREGKKNIHQSPAQ